MASTAMIVLKVSEDLLREVDKRVRESLQYELAQVERWSMALGDAYRYLRICNEVPEWVKSQALESLSELGQVATRIEEAQSREVTA